MRRPLDAQSANNSAMVSKGWGTFDSTPRGLPTNASSVSTTKPPPMEYISRSASKRLSASNAAKRMPFECTGSKSTRLKISWWPVSKAMRRLPSKLSSRAVAMVFTRCVTDTVSTRSGTSPSSPSKIATSVPWPWPVWANEPYNSTSRRAMRSKSAGIISNRNRRAARIGPTVWELDGPMPILNMSNREIYMEAADVWRGSVLCHSRPLASIRGYDRLRMQTQGMARFSSHFWPVRRTPSRLLPESLWAAILEL